MIILIMAILTAFTVVCKFAVDEGAKTFGFLAEISPYMIYPIIICAALTGLVILIRIIKEIRK